MSKQTSQLLATKLFVVRPQGSLVEREQLAEVADELLRRRLTLICAPAGFGKTTLISSWIARKGYPAAWVSLDSGDNDLARFLSYLVGAVQTVVPQSGAVMSQLLASSPLPPIEIVLGTLINHLATIEQDFLIVLDDYHVIENPAVHEAFLFLLDNLPPAVHLVVTTRADLPIPLSRFRVRRELIEIRASDLRFSASETASFLNDLMSLSLTPDQVDALMQRTEGWVAGLQMAGLSLQGREDVGEFINAFTGADRYVLDYLLEEVLNRLPEDLQQSMLELSVLDRFNAPLCEAVTERGNGAGLLDQLERGNLFLISLDNRREWYRYHHLFADLLQFRLRQSRPAIIPELHRRAVAWYETRELLSDAIVHAMEADDPPFLAGFVAGHWREIIASVDRKLMDRTFEVLPEELVMASPELSLMRAWLMIIPRRHDELEILVSNVERTIHYDPESYDYRDMIGQVHLLRGMAAKRENRTAQAIEYCTLALEMLPDKDRFAGLNNWYSPRVLARTFLANAHSESGNREASREIHLDILHHARIEGDEHSQIGALVNLAESSIIAGHLSEGYAYLQEIIRFRGSPVLDEEISGGNSYHLLGHIFLERNELDKALEAALEARSIWLPFAPHQQLEILRLATLVHEARGEREQHLKVLEELESLKIPAPMAAAFASMIGACRARYELREGNLDAALKWAVALEASATADRSGVAQPAMQRRISLTYWNLHARVLLRLGRVDEALELLERQREHRDQDDRFRYRLEWMVLTAIALEHTGNRTEALRMLEQALKMASDESYIRVFVHESSMLAPLLAAFGRQRSAEVPRSFVAEITRACGVESPTELPSNVESSSTAAVESMQLTGRELEILELMSRGYSNRKIAEKLYLSINTIKTHISNLFDKLGATSRVDALVRARKSGVLERSGE